MASLMAIPPLLIVLAMLILLRRMNKAAEGKAKAIKNFAAAIASIDTTGKAPK